MFLFEYLLKIYFCFIRPIRYIVIYMILCVYIYVYKNVIPLNILILRRLCRLCAECVNRERASEEQDAFFHGLAANGTPLNLVATHLARAVAT